jgi:hypothetical protein
MIRPHPSGSLARRTRIVVREKVSARPHRRYVGERERLLESIVMKDVRRDDEVNCSSAAIGSNRCTMFKSRGTIVMITAGGTRTARS